MEIKDSELEESKAKIIGQIKLSNRTIAGAIIQDDGVNAFVIGGADAVQTAHLAFALQDIVNDINQNLLISLGEDNFERLQAEVGKAKKIQIDHRHESRKREV